MTANVLTRLLVPLDGSPECEIGYAYAAAIAGPSTEIVLGRAVSPIDGDRLDPSVLSAVTDTAVSRASLELAETAKRLAPTSHLGVEVSVGPPVDGMLGIAARVQATMIVAATHGRGSIGRWVYGSVTDRLARLSPIPVALVRVGAPRPAAKPARVVVPLDGSALAEEALPVAAAIARTHGIPVMLLTAIDAGQFAVATSPLPTSGAPAGVMPELWDMLKETAAQTLAHGQADPALNGLEVSAVSRVGTAQAVIDEVAGPADVVVLTSHGRTGFKRVMLGSVAEHVVRFADCPVVLVPNRERKDGQP